MPPKVNLKVPPRSGFDKSHQNLLTGKVGTLVPLMIDELIPNSKVDLKGVLNVSLPPLAADVFMRCNYKVEAFFVPSRLLYGGFSDWLTGQKSFDPNTNIQNYREVGIPRLNLTSSDYAAYGGSGSLCDYLGFRTTNFGTGQGNFHANLFPFLAYHRIYDDWYRAPLVQSKVFNEPMWHGGSPSTARLSTLPFINYVLNDSSSGTFSLAGTFDDGIHLGDLRQRNFGFDYFTTAQPSAQLGSPKGVSLSWSSGATNTTMTIAALRAANSLQQFAERNQLAGYRLQDYVRANYGANLSSGVAQRAILLGSGEITCYSKGIYQNANGDGGAQNENPFSDSVGAQFGSMSCNGEINLCSNFTAEEPGYIIVLGSLVPKVTYSTGIDRMFNRYNAENSQTDMANPLLQNVGNQPIYMSELNGAAGDFVNKTVFGYSDRFCDFKYKNDSLHGLLRSGQSLAAFALQRGFAYTATPTISSAFLEIPTNYLDNVSAVSGSISQFGYWLDSFFRYRVSMPLASYSIPSLQDPAYEHGHDVTVTVGGSRL